MREDLIKLLNFKLKHITKDIDELNKLNHEIDDENNRLDSIENSIENFKKNEKEYDIYRFSNLDRETFNRLLMELDDEILTKFGTNSCNYDGLIYLINGINNGISLTLTKEQVDAINLLIDKLLAKESEYQNKIGILLSDKDKLKIKDISELEDIRDDYSSIIDDIDDEKYITKIDEIVEALNYSNLSNEKSFEILCYLLKYNSDIYAKEELKKDEIVEENKNSIDLTVPFKESNNDDDDSEITNDNNDIDLMVPFKNSNDLDNEESNDNISLTGDLENSNDDDTMEFSNSENIINEKELSSEIENTDDINENVEINNNELPDFENKYDDISLSDEVSKEDFKLPLEPVDIPISEEEQTVEDDSLNNLDELPTEEYHEVKINDEDDSSNEIDSDFKDIGSDDYEEYNPALPSLSDNGVDISNNINENINQNIDENVGLSTNEDALQNSISAPEKLQIVNKDLIDTNDSVKEEEKVESNVSPSITEDSMVNLFHGYNCDYNSLDDVTKSLLLKGTLSDYEAIFNKLDQYKAIDLYKETPEILAQIIQYSSASIIDEIVEIIGNSLSIDEKDKAITTMIAFKTLPSIFIRGESGNYTNFVENIASYKEYGIDLINLFDFSKELYVADHDMVVNNYNLIRSYDLTVNDKNAKYLLLLPDIASRIDYYVESVYKDTMKGSKNNTFDGIDLVKLYPNKLNNVTNTTIKRLRYSSENGKKIFGSKEKSLSGEITNLKVDVLNIPSDYLNKFFNNEFDTLSKEEVKTYQDLVANKFASFDVSEDLSKLEQYHNGLRYSIEGINISRNKVIRNYNILINNNVDKNKALLFALCNNLIITKEEYEKIKAFVNSLGGN